MPSRESNQFNNMITGRNLASVPQSMRLKYANRQESNLVENLKSTPIQEIVNKLDLYIEKAVFSSEDINQYKELITTLNNLDEDSAKMYLEFTSELPISIKLCEDMNLEFSDKARKYGETLMQYIGYKYTKKSKNLDIQGVVNENQGVEKILNKKFMMPDKETIDNYLLKSVQYEMGYFAEKWRGIVSKLANKEFSQKELMKIIEDHKVSVDSLAENSLLMFRFVGYLTGDEALKKISVNI